VLVDCICTNDRANNSAAQPGVPANRFARKIAAFLKSSHVAHSRQPHAKPFGASRIGPLRMQIVSYRPSKPVVLLLHLVFSLIYALLLTRTAISFYEGSGDLSKLTDDSAITHLIKRVCGEILAPFWAAGFPSNPDDLLWQAIIMALLTYALVHYGMFMKLERNDSMIGRVLQLCRAIFFLAGALLIVLVVLRMSVMLYQDVRYGRPHIGIVTSEK
jgi:hypothetical protein